ncbi:putative ABC transporter ATP-binding protein YxlF [compost metagenome]
MSEWVIETKGLSKSYKGRYAVSNLNLKIKKGDIYGFLGPNGAGKTTTIRMLLGLIKPTSGSVHIFGKPLAKDRIAILRKIGSLVEYPSYYGHLSATDNLEAIRRILDVPPAKISEVLDIVGLSKEAHRPVKGFSLGMKQRLGIASALLGSPELLVLDEPTNGLDPSGIQEIRELIKQMPKQHGITVLISSHLLSEVELTAGTVGIIRQGELVFQNTIERLHQEAHGQLSLVVSDPELALSTLQDYGLHAQISGSSILLEHTPNRTIALVVKSLVERNHSIYRIEERKKSLEELFLQIVGEGKLS